MIKIIFIFLFIFILLISKKFIFFYNIIFLIRFINLFIFIVKDEIYFIIRLNFGLDLYSYFIIILRFWILSLVFIIIEIDKSIIYNYLKKSIIFLSLLLILIIFFISINLLIFYLIFELRLIPIFIIIVYWGLNYERLIAAYYLLLYTIFISLPLLIYLIKLIKFNGSFDLIILIVSKIKFNLGVWDYLILFIAFYIKLPIYIFHVWLPKAHLEAPVYGSIILAAVILKLGGYGLLRFIKIFMFLCVKYNYLAFRVRIIGGLLIRLVCLVQIDMKKLVAYSSVVHMNILLCSLLTLMKLGVNRAYILIISHGLCSSGLFFIVNLYYERSLSRLIFLNKGIMNLFFFLRIWWFILCVVNFSFPFSLNFFREILIINVIIRWEIFMVIIVAFICLFRRAYSLYLYSYIQHGVIIFEGEFLIVYIKDLIILFIHIYPLILFIMNISMFY